jgi:uracil-DNA glycosylase
MPRNSEYHRFKKDLLESGCELCGLCRGRTQIVVDRGDPSADVMIIGEAPGANEDLQGKAFVGRSGKLLDGMLRELGFDTEKDALIANVVKCRPPDNRPPKDDEAEACLPFLRKQIELVDPRMIVFLGATALKRLLPDRKAFSMKEQVGKVFRHPSLPGRDLLALYHPAYILRDPRKKTLMAGHLRSMVDLWSARH